MGFSSPWCDACDAWWRREGKSEGRGARQGSGVGDREREREKDHDERRGSSKAAALADSRREGERVQKCLGLGGIRALGQKVKGWPCWAGLKGRLGREKERANLEG